MNRIKAPHCSHLMVAAATMILGFASIAAQAQPVEHDTALDEAVMSKIHYCQEHFPSCKTVTKHSPAILVFPSVVKADLIIGGAGGKGALVENGKITGYYSIGSASAGLQAGVENASQIYAFPSGKNKALQELKNGSSYWRVGDTENIVIMAADANARSVTGKTAAFIFDAKGLHAGVSVDLFDVWKTGSTRPEGK